MAENERTDMSTPMLGLRTTVNKVADLAKAKDWYTDVFQVSPYFDEPFYVGFNVAGYELGLMPDDMPAADKTDNVLSYWGVDDIDTEFARLKSLGATAESDPVNVGGEIMVAELKDPWGNTIGLIYNPEFKLPD
jgi:predicted enzyme related to lactoylglutathione lyase